MSTRSFISRKLPDGTYKAIYCHFDGYPDGVGKILKAFYTDSAKVDELLNLGDISSLAPEIGSKHNFEDNSASHYLWVKAYHRDKGEKWEFVKPKIYRSLEALRKAAYKATGEYLYIFEEEKGPTNLMWSENYWQNKSTWTTIKTYP